MDGSNKCSPRRPVFLSCVKPKDIMGEAVLNHQLYIIHHLKNTRKLSSSTGPQYSVSTGTTNINLEGQ